MFMLTDHAYVPLLDISILLHWELRPVLGYFQDSAQLQLLPVRLLLEE
jgi:hypothetical protein